MSLATLNSKTELMGQGFDEDGSSQSFPVPAMSGAIRSEIEAQVAVAHRYPRSIKNFLDDAISFATRNERIAKACIYAVPRGSKMLNGPSVRLAEIMASCYGNMRVETFITEIDSRFVTVKGVCLDTQKNYGRGVEVKRRITDSKGKTYSEDMIAVTTAAASAIASRNAIFAVIPNAFRDEVYEAVQQVAIGKGQSFSDVRDGWLTHFNTMGVTTPRILEVLGVRGIEDMTFDHTATLLGIDNRINDGASINEMFPLPAAPVDPTKSKSADIAAKLKGQPEPGSQG